MAHRLKNRLIPLVVMLGLAGPAGAQDLSWPMIRHDAWRANHAEGQGLITRPAVQARLVTGTTVGARALSHADIGGDGAQEIFLVDAGRIIARDLDNQLIWDTPNLGFTEIHGVYDFNGDGQEELLAMGLLGLGILDVDTGLPLWRKADFAADNNQTHDRNTKVGDLDGDGLPEIIVKSHWTSDGLIHAYTFKDGFYANPEDNDLWAYTLLGYKQGIFPAVGDFDGDGTPEVISIGLTGYETVDAVTGDGEIYVADTGVSFSAGPTYAVQLDDDPQLEAVRIAKQAGRGMAVTVFDLAKTPNDISAYLQWDPSVVRIDVPFECIADMDGDGFPEIVINRWDGDDWNFSVLQYSEGEDDEGNPTAELVIAAAIQGLRVRGLIDLDGDGRFEAIAEETVPETLQFGSYGRVELLTFNGAELNSVWQRDSVQLISGWRPLPMDANSFLTVPPLVTLDIGGTQAFLTQEDRDGDYFSDAVLALDIDGNIIAELAVADDEPMVPIRAGQNLSSPDAGPQLLIEVGESLSIAEADLSVLPPRITTASYEPESIVANLDGDARPELIFRRASGNILAWEATGPLGINTVFAERWVYPRTTVQQPVFSDLDQDGSVESIFRYQQESGSTTFEILGADGEPWGDLTVFVTIATDPMVADLNGDGVMDIIAFYVAAAEDYAAMAIDGATLTFLWDASLPGGSNAPYAHTGLAVDVNDDDTVDICMAMDSGYFGCLSGTDGAVLTGATTGTNRGAAMVGQADDDPAQDLVMVNHNAIKRYSLDLIQEWVVTRADTETEAWGTNTFILRGALGDVTGDGLDEIFAAAAVERLYRFNPDGSTGFVRYLRGGEVLTTGGDIATAPQLSRSALGDIDGDGALEVLVGSGDGWLYSIDAATGDKEWALGFTQRVGAPILADVDGDSKLEIVVSVGDGYIHIIDQAPLIAPSEVRDVPVSNGGQAQAGSPDIDEVEASTTLAAAWEAVEGASGYSASVETENGSLAVPWQDVGAQTDSTFDGYFILGSTYFVNVAAYDETGALGEVSRSDGVTVIDLANPTVTELTVDPDPFDPERERTSIEAFLSDSNGVASYALQISDGDDLIRAWENGVSGNGRNIRITVEWDGTNADSALVADGTYDVTLTAFDVVGKTGEASTTVTVERRPDATPTPTATEAPPTATQPQPTPTQAPPTGSEPEVTPTAPETTPTPVGPTATQPPATGTQAPTPTDGPTYTMTPTQPPPTGIDTPGLATPTPTEPPDASTDAPATPTGEPDEPGCGGCSSADGEASPWMGLLILGLALGRLRRRR